MLLSKLNKCEHYHLIDIFFYYILIKKIKYISKILKPKYYIMNHDKTL